MNSTEMDSFINTVLVPLWPDWTPTDIEAEMWRKELSSSDFNLSKAAVMAWVSNQDRLFKKPIIGKLKVANCFRGKPLTDEERQAAKMPIRVFTIIEQELYEKRPVNEPDYIMRNWLDNWGHPSFVGNRSGLPQDVTRIERAAETARAEYTLQSGRPPKNHIIIKDWLELKEYGGSK